MEAAASAPALQFSIEETIHEQSDDKRWMCQLARIEPEPDDERHPDRLSIRLEHMPDDTTNTVMLRTVKATAKIRWYTSPEGKRGTIYETTGPVTVVSRHRSMKEEHVLTSRSRHHRNRGRRYS